jgi:hypothetical protein
MNRSRLVVFLRGSLFWGGAFFVIVYLMVFFVRMFGYLFLGNIGEFHYSLQLISVAERTWVVFPFGVFVWACSFFESGRHKRKR